jgi:hypothetical protein
MPALISGLHTLGQWTRTWPGRAKLLVLIVVLGIVPALSYNGFCFGEKRFLSDDEFIDVAVATINRVRTHTLKIRHPRAIEIKPVEVINYGSVAEFRKLNPDCCAIIPHNTEVEYVSFWDQIFGRAAKSVKLRYTLNYLDDNGTPQSVSNDAKVTIGNCGRVFNPGY